MVSPSPAPELIRLWQGQAPLSRGSKSEDISTLTVFRPEKPGGSAVVICPGGGYGMLADHEGSGYAKYLVRHGITAFVLQYRLATHGYRHPAMMLDGQRAVRLVRSRAQEFGIDPHKIGIMGSSAGGHLASTVVTHFDAGDSKSEDPIERESCRPDFGILCYAVISFGVHTHGGSKANLLGPNPTEDLVRNLSNELQVTEKTPPCFIWHTVEDEAVPVENAQLFAAALEAKRVPYELHLYQRGGHGMGLRGDPEGPESALHPWAGEMVRWLKENGWAS